jgi:hypothetical protein
MTATASNKQHVSDLPPIKDFSEFLSIPAVVEKYPDIFHNENTLRWMLRDRDRNGLADCVLKVGKGLKLHVPRLLHLMMLKQHGHAA